MKHDRGGHALVIVIYNRKENRRSHKTADLLHLRNMLVMKGQAVDSGSVQGLCLVGGFIRGDHLFAAARITGEGKAGKGIVSGDDAHTHQRGSTGNKACGMAAGIGDPPAVSNGVALFRGKLREPIGPVVICAVGG